MLLCILIYHETVTSYGNPISIDEIHWSMVGILLFSGLTSSLFQVRGFYSVIISKMSIFLYMQSFFAYKIRVMSGRLLVGSVPLVLCAVRLCLIITIAAYMMNSESITEYSRKHAWTIYTALSLVAFGDLLNTSAFCFFLWTRRSGINRYVIRFESLYL